MPTRQKLLPLMLVLLSGCAMIPNYQTPDLPVASMWPFSSQAKAESSEASSVAASLGWRDFFKSAELRALVEKGLLNNRDLRIAALNIEATRASYRIQRSDLMPDVTAGGSLTRQHTPETLSSTGQGQTSSSYRADVATASFELDLFGRLQSLNTAALEEYLASEEARTSVQISLISEIANAYLKLLADRAQQQLAQQTLVAQQDSYDIFQRRFEEGIGSQLDVSQAKTLLETARVDSLAYNRLVQQDRNALELLVGAPVSEAELVGTFAEADQFVTKIAPGLPSDLLLNRPDVRNAEHGLKVANANIGAARAAFFPTISLTAAGGTAGAELSQLFGAGSGVWSFVPQISLPIFEGGRNVAALDLADVRKNIAVAQYEKTVQTAFRDVADALVARGSLGDELAAQQQLVDATSESYRLADARYQQGVKGYLDVLDARRSLYGAQQQLINHRLALLQNDVTVYTVLGGGQLEASASSAATTPAKEAAPAVAASTVVLTPTPATVP